MLTSFNVTILPRAPGDSKYPPTYGSKVLRVKRNTGSRSTASDNLSSRKRLCANPDLVFSQNKKVVAVKSKLVCTNLRRARSIYSYLLGGVECCSSLADC